MDHATPARFLAAHEATATAPLLPANWLSFPAPLQDFCALRLHQQLPPPRAGLVVSVIVPAKDEAANLPAILAALAAQTNLHGQALPPDSFEVIVLAHSTLLFLVIDFERVAWQSSSVSFRPCGPAGPREGSADG